jgi:hypothetical protein
MYGVLGEFEIRSVEIGLGFDYRSLGVWDFGILKYTVERLGLRLYPRVKTMLR